MTDRKDRGKTQQLFLIESLPAEGRTRGYVIMGSTGNVYTVTIQSKPECTCPDYRTRYNRCKHIYFVLIRIMKTKNEDQTVYSNSDLDTMFNNIPDVTKNLIVNDNIKNKYDKANNKEYKEKEQQNTDDLCPICLDDLTNGEELDHCKFSCGRAVHTVCCGMWTKKNERKCVFCSAGWDLTVKTEGEYINVLA